MPIYLLKCKVCECSEECLIQRALSAEELEDLPEVEADRLGVPRCPVHKGLMVKQPVQGAPRRDNWPVEGLVIEHLYPDREHRFMSRKELQSECKRLGVTSGALL